MKRLEIIANQSIEEDLFELLRKRGLAKKYTKIPGVHGAGNSEPKQGDHIWPEENFILILYCEEGDALATAEVIRELKTYFPTEGIKLFESNAEQTV
jgi:hypothetical protein